MRRLRRRWAGRRPPQAASGSAVSGSALRTLGTMLSFELKGHRTRGVATTVTGEPPMTSTFDENRFRDLWRNADIALQLRQRAEDVMRARPLTSLTGSVTC